MPRLFRTAPTALIFFVCGEVAGNDMRWFEGEWKFDPELSRRQTVDEKLPQGTLINPPFTEMRISVKDGSFIGTPSALIPSGAYSYAHKSGNTFTVFLDDGSEFDVMRMVEGFCVPPKVDAKKNPGSADVSFCFTSGDTPKKIEEDESDSSKPPNE